MKKVNTLKGIITNIYIWVFIYYILAYPIFFIPIYQMNIFSIIYFIIIFAIIPLSLLIFIVTRYKTYSLKSILNIFFISYLIGIPIIHLFLIGFAATEGGVVNNIIIFNTFIASAIFSIFIGLAGIVLNSIYIIFVNIKNNNTNKKEVEKTLSSDKSTSKSKK